MHSNPIFAHEFCFPELKSSLERTQVKELVPDVWLIEGNLGLSFFLAPPSSNSYVLRDESLVLVLDTGIHPYYRTKILDVLDRFRKDGAKTLVLMVTQGHWDHAMNNDVILEAGYEEVRFLLPEPEVSVIESIHHWLQDFRRLEFFYEPYSQWIELVEQFEECARGQEAYERNGYGSVWEAIRKMKNKPDASHFRAAIKLLGERILFKNFRSLAEQAEVLQLDRRERRRYGDVEVKGWQVGRFFAIHDGSHSPGHVCIYDPKNKLILTGDVTIEINPAFFDTSMERLIQAAGSLRRMAQQGFIEVAADSHRNPVAMTEVMGLLGLEPFHDTQLKDAARGAEECTAFLKTFEDYYVSLRDETLAAHARLGEATVKEIVSELEKSTNPHTRFKTSFPFPSRPEVLVARVLDENGYNRRKKGDRILFSPPEKWRF